MHEHARPIRLAVRFGALAASFTFLVFGCTPADPRAAVGCGTQVVDPLAAITVAEAHLEDLQLWQAGLAAGRTDGRATLVVTDVDGNVLEFDAMLQGSHAGLVMDASVDVAFDTEFPLVLPATPVSVRGLLGNYEGTHVGIDLIAGLHWRDLQNAALVRLNVTTLSFGLGFVPITWEVIGIQLFDDPIQLVDDPCAFGGCFDTCTGGDGICDVGCGDPDCTCDDEGDCDVVAQLGEPCEWFQPGDAGTCAFGLVCVRRAEQDDVGLCRAPCAANPDVCAELFGDTSTCQDATVLPSIAVEATVCLDRRGADAPCAAAFDVDACDDGFECRPAGLAADDLRCKETCDDDSDDSDDVCTDAAETCVPTGTLEGRGPSTCGVTVEPLPSSVALRTPLDRIDRIDELDARFVCNEREGNRYCDQSMFDDAHARNRDPGVSLCLNFSPFNGDGFCFPLCATPTIDRDGDGAIDDDEKGASFDCDAGLSCTPSLALATGVYDAPPTFPGGTVPRSCDPALCPEGASCAACGPGDATCSTAFGSPLCLAPFGSCE